MSVLRFFVLTCIVFLLVGPLIPVPSLIIHAALSTGDLSKLNGMFMFSGMSYLFGGLIALKFGAVFAVVLILLVRLWPRLVPKRGTCTTLLFGASLGATVGFGFIAPSLVVRISSMRANPPFQENLSLSLLVWWRSGAPSMIVFFLLPSLVCGAIVAWWLLPKLMVNHYNEQTATDKPIAAPHIERYIAGNKYPTFQRLPMCSSVRSRRNIILAIVVVLLISIFASLFIVSGEYFEKNASRPAPEDKRSFGALGALSIVSVQVAADVAARFSLDSLGNAGGGVTPRWVQDRAAMTDWLGVSRGFDTLTGGISGRTISQAVNYEDRRDDVTLGTRVLLGTADQLNLRVQVLFGSDANDTLTGYGRNDRLYGGTGNDTVLGDTDTYRITAGEDFNTVIDADGQEGTELKLGATLYTLAGGKAVTSSDLHCAANESSFGRACAQRRA